MLHSRHFRSPRMNNSCTELGRIFSDYIASLVENMLMKTERKTVNSSPLQQSLHFIHQQIKVQCSDNNRLWQIKRNKRLVLVEEILTPGRSLSIDYEFLDGTR